MLVYADDFMLVAESKSDLRIVIECGLTWCGTRGKY